LSEYRTRLTADVVTGKLDVREVAARLPDEDGKGGAKTPEEVEMDAAAWMNRKAASSKSSKPVKITFTFFHYIVTVTI
jgi:hypothetical protein